MPLPILYESRRRHVQRFLILLQLSIPLLWFPLIRSIILTQIQPGTQVIVPLDRTQWKQNNLFVVSIIWDKRAWPIYWQFMEHSGSSNLARATRFKDCKSGGYNLEESKACVERLTNLVLLIAIAYTCAGLQGQLIKSSGQQKYIGRLKELNRMTRRHSNFWVGLYGQMWITALETCSDWVKNLMIIRPTKRKFFQRGLRAMTVIQTAF